MISLVSGEVRAITSVSVTVMVGGVGYEIFLGPRHLVSLREGDEITLHTRLIVREDDMSLFGFQSSRERELFDELNSVSGIGPKLALTVLSGMDSDEIVSAIANQDEARFRAIPGVGPKTAKLILISLGGKTSVQSVNPKSSKVLAALAQLGADDSKARAVLAELPGDIDEGEMLKRALAALGKEKLR